MSEVASEPRFRLDQERCLVGWSSWLFCLRLSEKDWADTWRQLLAAYFGKHLWWRKRNKALRRIYLTSPALQPQAVTRLHIRPSPLKIILNCRSVACPVSLGGKGYSARKIDYVYINKSCVLPLADWDVTTHRVTLFSNIFIFHGLLMLRTSRSLKQWGLELPCCCHSVFFHIYFQPLSYKIIHFFPHFHFYLFRPSILP